MECEAAKEAEIARKRERKSVRSELKHGRMREREKKIPIQTGCKRAIYKLVFINSEQTIWSAEKYSTFVDLLNRQIRASNFSIDELYTISKFDNFQFSVDLFRNSNSSSSNSSSSISSSTTRWLCFALSHKRINIGCCCCYFCFWLSMFSNGHCFALAWSKSGSIIRNLHSLRWRHTTHTYFCNMEPMAQRISVRYTQNKSQNVRR